MCAPVFAQTSTTTDTSSLQTLIQTLQQQIQALKTEVETLRQAQTQVQQTSKDISQTLKLIRGLREGMSGDDVKMLQEILATDPEIYPEGLITGYYGRLTARAIMKFQKKIGLEQVGVVGPKTISRINELLEEGAGKSGKIPPGLLTAPGILKKLGLATTTPPYDDDDEDEDENDVTPPVISGISATNITATSTRIVWITNEKATSKVWYSAATPVTTASTTPSASSSELVINHDIGLSDLTASTTYYYFVSSSDKKGNTASSSESSFTTLGQ